MIQLSQDQQIALNALKGKENIFLTGAAGSGKSFLINKYTQEHLTPIVASTGAAAVLVNGVTFHSFFSLGILKGGIEKTIERAVKDSRLKKRLESISEVIVDEISMIDPEAFYAAEQICKLILDPTLPFGGLRIIAVGDFFQLPPVQKNYQTFWLFQTHVWQELNFKIINLNQIMRTQDLNFIEHLNNIREGNCKLETHHFFQSLAKKDLSIFDGTVLFGKRADVEAYNLKKLSEITGTEHIYETEIEIKSKSKLMPDRVLKMSPLPNRITLKKEALVMIRKNHPFGVYVNGTLGRVQSLSDEVVKIKTHSGKLIDFTREKFEVLNADGEVEATIENFPLTLAWASTIHKAQGATIDQILVDMDDIWERGQAYVALSRAKSSEGLYIMNWNPNLIKVDTRVQSFYNNLCVD